MDIHGTFTKELESRGVSSVYANICLIISSFYI